jgi:heme-degrading monooxygenase HmoA
VIARCWSARTSSERVPLYADHLRNAVFPELEKLAGYKRGTLLRREMPDAVVEVLVITYWDSLDSIRSFAGNDGETAVVADQAAALLNDFDRRVRHYEVVF